MAEVQPSSIGAAVAAAAADNSFSQSHLDSDSPATIISQINDCNAPPDVRTALLWTAIDRVVGNVPEKKSWVRHGALPAIVAILRPKQRPEDESEEQDVHMAESGAAPPSADCDGGDGTDEVEVDSPEITTLRITAMKLLGIFARGVLKVFLDWFSPTSLTKRKVALNSCLQSTHPTLWPPS